MPPIAFKTSFVFTNQVTDEFLTSFHHNDVTESIIVHVSQIFFAKISSIKNKSNLSIAISLNFFNHKLQLRNIINTSWILLIHQWFTIIQIISYGIVKDWEASIHLSSSVLDHTDISGFAVLIRRIIRDINPLSMISFFIPFVQKSLPLILINTSEEFRKSGITINFHVFCKQRMVKRIVRIILCCITLRND